MIDWELKGVEFINCNCDYGCPCQFNARPTHGDCHAIGAYRFEDGHFGDVDLSGLNVVGMFSWPKAIHEGNGTAFLIIDERASEKQRDALLSIFSGENTEPGKTIWNVFAATFTEVLPPEIRPIHIEIDVEERTGTVRVDGFVKMVGEPIRNPVTGDKHRARIDLPNGFEYLIAEMGSGSSTAQGPMPLTLENSYGQFANIHLTNKGVVHA
ncbi:hypothetical protein AUC70_09885 [Methyloceanibacter stevinii]|uniref:DUF1326 domain-containing protein n=1 Tax=Methyloceanibacter stevinii TaxID=1774970 RepID=A0A1E3VK77_9HYPH|nr:DUF1326 domain-containing protein [Methyloceanibacter stevinii]ODR93913.1 hypothetical protein AUC70_09885 [Methyloceanibacter stevinii]